MKLKKLNKESKGRMTLTEEIASFFRTSWTVEDGYFYIACVESLPPENRQLVEMIQAMTRVEVPNEQASH